jgi:hypothetical protein
MRETEKKIVYNLLFAYPEEQRLCLRTKDVLQGNIKLMLHKYKFMNWVQLAQDGIQRRSPENTVIHVETVKGEN